MIRVFIFLQYFLLLCSCLHKDVTNVDVGRSDTSASSFPSRDTIVYSIQGIEATEKQYFLIVNSDTSKFSLFVSQNSFGNIVASYTYVPHRNYSQTLDADSAATYENFNEQNRPSGQDFPQIAELRHLMKGAGSDYDMTKLKTIRFALKDISGLSDSVTKYYRKTYGQKITIRSSKLLAEIIFNSQFIHDLNNWLRLYGKSVKVISIDGLIYERRSESLVGLFDGLVILTL